MSTATAAPAPPTSLAEPRSHSPPPLEADGVHDPEVDNYRDLLEEYRTNLPEDQALAYKIAYRTLGHSYTIVRSQAFLAWLDKHKA